MTNELVAIAIICCAVGATAFHAQASDAIIVEDTTPKVERQSGDGVVNSDALKVSFNQNTAGVNFEKIVEVPVVAPVHESVSHEGVLAKITFYGVDCYGCYNVDGFGGTAGGVKVSTNPSVMQSDGTWRSGITYDGYYIVAANGSVPMGSIIEVSNHGFDGYGLVAGQPFYAMVLDRGAMTLNHLDLFVGSEANIGVTRNSAYTPTMKVVRNGY